MQSPAKMLRKTLLVALAAFAAAVEAGPVPRAAAVTGELSLHVLCFSYFLSGTRLMRLSVLDVQVFQFALTLEHLENAFYTAALAKFNVNDFVAAGYPSSVYGRFVQIAGHERTHVKYLTESLGPNAVPACTYDL